MYGREALKPVYKTSCVRDTENFYGKDKADKVMDAMEARIKELEKALDNAITGGKIALEQARKLESQLPKWISVKDRLPNVGDIVLVCFDERFKSHFFPIGMVRWDSSYELQEISVTHWQPLPPPPTTEEK